MIKQIKIITCAAAAALLLATLALPAHAGTLTIYNKNCIKVKGFKKYKRVSVHVWGPDECNTKTTVTVHQGESTTITLDEYYRVEKSEYNEGTRKECIYAHEAKGTVFGGHNVRGTEDSHVTCKKDSIGVCQCKKD